MYNKNKKDPSNSGSLPRISRLISVLSQEADAEIRTRFLFERSMNICYRQVRVRIPSKNGINLTNSTRLTGLIDLLKSLRMLK